MIIDGRESGGFNLAVMSNSFCQESFGGLFKDGLSCFGLD